MMFLFKKGFLRFHNINFPGCTFPGNDHISLQTGKRKNPILKICFGKGYVSSPVRRFQTFFGCGFGGKLVNLYISQLICRTL